MRKNGQLEKNTDYYNACLLSGSGTGPLTFRTLDFWLIAHKYTDRQCLLT